MTHQKNSVPSPLNFFKITLQTSEHINIDKLTTEGVQCGFC